MNNGIAPAMLPSSLGDMTDSVPAIAFAGTSAPRVLTAPEQDAAGEWHYPDAWRPEHRERFEEAKGETIAHEREAQAIQDRAAAIMQSPDMLIEIAAAEAAEMKRAVEYTRRRSEGEISWLKARAQFGDDVRRIDVEPDGDVIIMRRMPEAAVEAGFRLMNEIAAAKRATLKPDATAAEIAAAEQSALLAMRGSNQDVAIANATIPGEPDEKSSAARLRVLLAKYWGLWPRMIVLRDEMIQGWRASEGKGSAPS